MLSVKQLLSATRATHPNIINNARSVRLNFSPAAEVEDDDGDLYREIKAIGHGNTIPREITLRLYGKRGPESLAWVSCTCEWFLYHCEVALWAKRSSDIEYSNGFKPEITNPRMVPLVCKHIAAAFMQGAANMVPSRKVQSKAPPVKKVPEKKATTSPTKKTPAAPAAPKGPPKIKRPGE